ncbi:hypothetical protein [Nonomuraea sp. NPDC049709]|uniref:hypothetical protein n=1 Tax=Nonomuraea sp. NPDC049709 TaxID=3154736 RepID=UPI0034410C38
MNSREPFDDLEAELLALGDLIDVPTPPPADVAATVRARLEAAAPDPAPDPAHGPTADPAPDPAPDPAHGPVAGPVRPPSRRDSRAPGRRDGRRRRTRWAIVAAVVVAVVTVTAATPQGRAAVAQILRFAGIELRIGDETPPPITTPTPIPGEHPVTLDDLPNEVRFQVRIPSALGDPQRVTVADRGRVVSMFWPGGIRLDQFDGAVRPFFFKKLGPPFPDHTLVNGGDAWWIPGAHPLGYIPRQDGTEVPLRQAAPTLIWQQDTLNYRLEGAGSVREAVRVAESLR